MNRRCAASPAIISTALLAATGCVSFILPVNLGLDLIPAGKLLTEASGARLKQVDREENLFWLEIERQGAPGTVGGFISPIDEHSGAIVLLFDGAGTLRPGGALDSALAHYKDYGGDFRTAGFMTWSVVLPEGNTVYGAEDLSDALEAIDWLARAGQEFLGVERVYVVGYSTGATTANLINLERDVTAVVSLGGLTHPKQLAGLCGYYLLVFWLFPENTGMRQLGTSTLSVLQPGSEAWERLNVLDHVAEIRNPTLFVHGTADLIFSVRNAQALEQRYRDLQAAGVDDLPALEFLYVPRGDHFVLRDDPVLRARVIEYLMQFEPTTGGAP